MQICALLVAWSVMGWFGHQEPAGEVRAMREAEFNIPVDADPQDRTDFARLLLYCSTDQGKTWAQAATAPPQALAFTYHARSDGLYWFKIGYIDKSTNQSMPQNVYDGPPSLRVIVDTRRPEIKLQSVERQKDQIEVNWEARDANLVPSSLTLESKSTGGTVWLPVVPALTGATGQQRFNVGTVEAVQLRLTARDIAGNMSQTVIDVPGESVVQPAGQNSPPQGGSGTGAVMPPTPPGQGTLTSQSPPQGSGAKPPTNNEFHPVPQQPTPPAAGGNPSRPALATSDTGMSRTPGSTQPLATSTPSQGGVNVNRNRYVHPSMQFTNQTHMEMNYKIPTIGPSGVGMVELWMTQDEGQTWTKHSEKQEPQPPYTFDVPGEGAFGFTLVVKSKAGLGRPAPKPGDAPSVRIEVDTSTPYVELHPVEADPRRKDILFLLWKAEDRNLGTTPVSLQWSENPNGPWQVVAENLPNTGGTAPLTGRYAWQMPAKLPYRIFLRVEVRDRAGNVGIAQTLEPVLVDLTVPEVEIIGVGAVKK